MATQKTKRKSSKRTTKRGKSGGKRSEKTATQASQADKYDLYQQTVQEAEPEVEFFERVYRHIRGGTPKILREDFCGTFQVSCEWAKKRGRQAIGVDNDAEPLDWGRTHNLAKLPADAQQRVQIMEDDVRKVQGPKADVLAAQNFSFFGFHTRDELREYFSAARQNLKPDGLMVLDMMGGPECWEDEREDVTDYGQFTYVWEAAWIDPLSHEGRWQIHFRFQDGSKLEPAFSYHWRLWTMPEVRELLQEAGFTRSHVYWEGTDEDGEGDGVWRKVQRGEADPCWIAYVVAEK